MRPSSRPCAWPGEESPARPSWQLAPRWSFQAGAGIVLSTSVAVPLCLSVKSQKPHSSPFFADRPTGPLDGSLIELLHPAHQP